MSAGRHASGSASGAQGGARDRGARVSVVFLCFFLSGFTGLLYQTVWMRLALARFGVNASVISTVITVFMFGLAVGTYLTGRWAEAIERRLRLKGLGLYAGAELVIALGGIVVPMLFDSARSALLSLGESDRAPYTLASGALLAAALFPFCVAMGATFPAALAYLKRTAAGSKGGYTFSYLYLGNVAGALVGVLAASFVLIELIGFRATLHVGVATNLAIAAIAWAATRGAGSGGALGDRAPVTELAEADGGHASRDATPAPDAGPSAAGAPTAAAGSGSARLAALFLTGFASMGMEVVWTRIYPPFIGTFVYSFAGILATYLVATAAGSLVYRRSLRARRAGSPWRWWHALCLASLVPLFAAASNVDIPGPQGLRIVYGIAPFCAILGVLTPWLLDEHAGYNPARVGRAYALNLVGCVLGPLLAGFVLIPTLGTQTTYLLLASPLFLIGLASCVRRERRHVEQGVAIALALLVWFASKGFEDRFPEAQVRNDNTATVVATGEGMMKMLYVNGVGMTMITPLTKMMVHFPLAHLPADSTGTRNGLVICFGMGTTFRSLASWEGRATVVELVPSVPQLFGYYFADADSVLAARAGNAHVEIDDGRRFLDRTDETFDLITIDPPPPVEAAGSSLLYSKEFYASAIRRLKPNGILQAWYPHPGGDEQTLSAVTQSLLESFPHVRACQSIFGWGVHYMASMSPIPALTAEEMLARMPKTAVRDMTEWSDVPAVRYFDAMLKREVDPHRLVLPKERGGGIALTDDRPVNEFFLLRRHVFPHPPAA